MKNKELFIISLSISIFLLITLVYFVLNISIPTNFKECAQAGNPILESYPRQCRDSFTNRTFVENISIGGQRDEYGCLIPAGYSWNEKDQLCVREWTRESCPEQQEEFCTTVYEPVCGLPDKQQYSNSCFACLNTPNIYFIEGECQ